VQVSGLILRRQNRALALSRICPAQVKQHSPAGRHLPARLGRKVVDRDSIQLAIDTVPRSTLPKATCGWGRRMTLARPNLSEGLPIHRRGGLNSGGRSGRLATMYVARVRARASSRPSGCRKAAGVRSVDGAREAPDAPISKVHLASTSSPDTWAGEASLPAGRLNSAGARARSESTRRSGRMALLTAGSGP
jgi:hypothetical protein